MLVEGPIVTYVAGFSYSLGFFNIYTLLILSILGNFLGDLIYFFIGRFSKKSFIDKYLNKLFKVNRMTKIKIYLQENPWKMLSLIKLTPPLPTPGLILTGTTNISTIKFFFYSFVISTIYSIVILFIGFYSGKAFNLLFVYIKNSEFWIAIVILFLIIFWFLFRLISDKVLNKIDRDI